MCERANIFLCGSCSNCKTILSVSSSYVTAVLFVINLTVDSRKLSVHFYLDATFTIATQQLLGFLMNIKSSMRKKPLDENGLKMDFVWVNLIA